MTLQETKLEQVKKSCHITNNVVKVIKIILTVGALLALIGAGVLGMYRNRIDAGIAEAIAADKAEFFTNGEFGDFGLITIDLDVQELVDQGQYALVMICYCAYAAVMCGLVCIIFSIIGKVFAIIETSNTPFSTEVLGKLRKSFIALVIWCLLISDSLGATAIFAMALWCIYCILDYGTTLQTEVDETL